MRFNKIFLTLNTFYIFIIIATRLKIIVSQAQAISKDNFNK